MPFLKDKSKLVSRSKKLENLSKKHGLRHAVFTVPGDKYIGEWDNNLKDGKGSLLTRTFKLYEGEWNRNFRHGFGVLAFRKLNKVFVLDYRGDWRKGLEYGFGARHYANEGYFLGYWKNGKRYGYGQMWYANGAFYDGDWANDKRHGQGMLVRSDGNRYEGSWALDLKHGKGRFFHLDSGQMQEGIWQDDVCVYSFVIDIPFRQTALQPTPYPIDISKLTYIEETCKEREIKALVGMTPSCFSFSKMSIHSKI